MSPSSATLQGGLCFDQLAEQSPLTWVVRLSLPPLLVGGAALDCPASSHSSVGVVLLSPLLLWSGALSSLLSPFGCVALPLSLVGGAAFPPFLPPSCE